MKSVLIAIQPKWCELIASGEKTIEVRKTRPKLQTPFKCYIYETSKKEPNGIKWSFGEGRPVLGRRGRGQVIGEFVCDTIDELYLDDFCSYLLIKETCISQDEIIKYTKKRFDKQLYGWHISDLKIYDKPKELGEFWKPCPFNEECDLTCPHAEVEYHGDEFGGDIDFIGCGNKITTAPQSWCYVEG